MAKSTGMKPSINAYEDFTNDLGWIDPKLLFEIIKHVGTYVFDVETCGAGNDALDPRKGRLDGIAFYVPAGAPKDFGALGYYDGKPVRAWFPFNDFSFMCHIHVRDIPGLEPKLAPIGVNMQEIYTTAKGKKPGDLILVNLRPPMDQDVTMEALRPIWQDLKDVIGITHHGKFDTGFLWVCPGTAHPIRVQNIWADSMLADFCTDERRKKYGLKVRIKQEFNHQMTPYAEAVRGQSLLAFCNAKPLGVYAMDDCFWEYRLHEKSIDNLREQEPAPKNRAELKWSIEKRFGRPMGRLERVYWGIDTRISEIIMEMQNAGVLIDWQWLKVVNEKIIKQKDEILQRIEKFLGWPLNPNATQQVADALFADPPDGLGLPQKGIPIGKTGIPSTSDKVIKHFARFHPLVADIIKWRSLDTIQGSFVTKLIKLALESPDGRVYANFNQTRTVIARLSSSNPINFQNQPRDKDLVRKAYCAFREGITTDDPDMVFLGGDYGQIELRVAAHLSKEENMLEVYRMGGICKAESGQSCPRYKVWTCEHAKCGHSWTPELWTAPNKSHNCPKCGSNEKTEHQARCRHVDLHQRTAEDANVKRNPLAKNCCTGDSMVLTEHGLLRIDEIVTGPDRTPSTMKIVCDDGKLRPLDSTYAGGEQDVLSVEMEYGLKVKATPDHEFFVMEEGKIVRKRADLLKAGDAAIIMTGRNVHGSIVDVPDVEVEAHTSYKDVNLPKRLTPEVARFLGYVVAEGRYESSPGRYQFWIGLGIDSKDMAQDLRTCFEHVIPDRVSVLEYEDKTVFNLASKKLNAWFDRLGIGQSSAEKNIPRCIRSAPWALKREFLRAYFEGDGTNKKPSSITGKGSFVVSCCSKSELLIRQIQAELANIDILGFIHSEWRDTDKGRQQYWCWSIRRQRDLMRFRELVGFVSAEKQSALDAALTNPVTDRANRYLDNVEPLLETIYDKVKRTQKDKLRQVIRRDPTNTKAPPVRLGDTVVDLLSDVLPEQIKQYVEAGIWTAKIQQITPAGRELVYDLYEPEHTAMIVNSCCVADCNFGLLYRMGAPKFCIYADLFDSDGMPMIDFAKEIIERWHTAYPTIALFHEITEFELKRTGWIAKTLFGRRRRLDQEARINHFRAVTQGIQFQVSGTAQDIMKTGMIRTWDAREERIANARPAERKLWEKFRFLMQIHDECIWQIPRQIADEAKVMVKGCMEGVGKGSLLLPLTFDTKTGRCWDDIH